MGGTTNQATLAQAGIRARVQALGLTLGQTVHIGSVASIGADVIHGFQNSAANDMVGYARVISMSGGSVVFDKVSPMPCGSPIAVRQRRQLTFSSESSFATRQWIMRIT